MIILSRRRRTQRENSEFEAAEAGGYKSRFGISPAEAQPVPTAHPGHTQVMHPGHAAAAPAPAPARRPREGKELPPSVAMYLTTEGEDICTSGLFSHVWGCFHQ